MNRLISAAMAGYAAFALAVAAGAPVWVKGPSWAVPGDATDIGTLVFLTILTLTKRNRNAD